MNTEFLRVREVSKSFAGRMAVDGLSFSVNRGEVFALLGPNGAGKTTTVRMLIGIIRPDQGRIEISCNGRIVDTLPPEGTGYLPEDRGLYREISVLRSLVYFARLRGLAHGEAKQRANEWLEKMSLLDRKDDRLDALSKGNQQRVQFVAAVIHRPAFAILDEPFSGLDPLSQEFFLDLVDDLRRAGTTILLSAHQMDLVERVADRVLLLNHGHEILSGSLHELSQRLDARPRLRLGLDRESDVDILQRDQDVEELTISNHACCITLRSGANTPQFLARIITLIPISTIVTKSPRLHDVFIRAVQKDDVQQAGRVA